MDGLYPEPGMQHNNNNNKMDSLSTAVQVWALHHPSMTPVGLEVETELQEGGEKAALGGIVGLGITIPCASANRCVC